MIGQTISHYKITEKLGQGGMGVVYKARDLKLERFVALKFLPHEISADEQYKRRFIHEAKAASALDHNNICTIHEIDQTDDGQLFIAMAYCQGETLKKKIQQGPLPLAEALDYAMQIAQGLAKAHSKDIVHRDIKPANVMVTEDGVVKIVDFGLAQLGDATKLTKTGSTLGTPAYMSPEQVQHQPVNRRTDIWSLGAVLYEMVTGQVPFEGQIEAAVAYSILHEEPQPLTSLRTGVPIGLDRVVGKALAKRPEERYQHVEEMLVDLRSVRKEGELGSRQRRPSKEEPRSVGFPPTWRRLVRPRVAITAFVAFLALGLAGVWFYQHDTKVRWAQEVAVPEVKRFIDEESYFAAFHLAEQAEQHISEDPKLAALRPQMSRKVSVQTTPPGADVFIKDYADVEGNWYFLGRSPLANIRMPLGHMRWRISKEGFVDVEAAALTADTFDFTLSRIGSIPTRKVHVSGGEVRGWVYGIDPIRRARPADFLIDKYEVTNKQYSTFVDADGYRKGEYWKHEFVENGRLLTWEEAMGRFRDQTGRPGPATWVLGDHPEGKGDFPVTGVSWYEAAAYAEFVGDSLPTIYHWIKAAGPWLGSSIIPLSNISGNAAARVGEYLGISAAGAYDMAGNVREWCWNESGGLRYALGGAWSDPAYMFAGASVRSPFDRFSYEWLSMCSLP